MTIYIVITRQTVISKDVAKYTEAFGRFVRLNLIGEIVEVVSFDSTDIMINYKGRILTMAHYEVSRITPEEEVAAKARGISG